MTTDGVTIARRLHGLRMLADNAAWKELLEPLLHEKMREELGRLSDPAATAEQRAGHVQSFHLAAMLAGCESLGIKSWLAETLAFYEAEGRKLNEAAGHAPRRFDE